MDKIKTSRLMILLVILAILTAYTYTLRFRQVELPSHPDLELIPGEIAGYSSIEEYIEPASLRTLGADATLARSFRDGSGKNIDLFLGYFASQQENSQIHSPKHCYPGSGWDVISEGSAELVLEAGRKKVKQLIISDGEQKQLVIYWFHMNGSVVPNEFSLKYNQMKNALLSRPQSAAFIRFSTPLAAGSEKETRESLTRFIEEISPDIGAALAESVHAGEK